MTAVAYSIGTFTTKSYAEALAEKERTGLSIVRHYIPIPEVPALDEEAKRLRDIRVAKRKGAK